MSGFHGKNVEIKVSSSELLLGSSIIPGASEGALKIVETIPGTDIPYLALSGSVLAGGSLVNMGNWRFGYGVTSVNLHYTGGTEAIDANGYLIHYPTGTVAGRKNTLGQTPVSGTVVRTSIMQNLNTAATLVGSARSFNVEINSDTVDTTTIGSAWQEQVEGIQGWTGTMDGLWIDTKWYQYAVSTISGTIPRAVIRFAPDPLRPKLVYQGTAIFPTMSFNAPYDGAIQNNVSFTGLGPLQLIKEDGKPYFGVFNVAI